MEGSVGYVAGKVENSSKAAKKRRLEMQEGREGKGTMRRRSMRRRIRREAGGALDQIRWRRRM